MECTSYFTAAEFASVGVIHLPLYFLRSIYKGMPRNRVAALKVKHRDHLLINTIRRYGRHE